MNFSSLLSTNVTLFLLMICGFVCRRLGIIDSVASKNLSRLILSVGLPMMIIGALNSAPYTEEHLQIALRTTAIGFVMHILMAFLARLICRKMKHPDRSKIIEFGLVFANCGFLGFPVLDSLLNVNEATKGLGSFMGAFYVISFHIALWTWGIVILGRGREDIKLTPKKALLNFGTVPCLIGVAIYLLKPVFVLPAAMGDFFNYLGGLCTPISVLITGALLATVSIGKMFQNGPLYLFSFFKLLAFPILFCVLAKLCGLSDTEVLLCTVMAGLPSAATITMLAEIHDIEPGYASQSVGITSLLATLSVPAVVLFAQWINNVL